MKQAALAATLLALAACASTSGSAAAPKPGPATAAAAATAATAGAESTAIIPVKGMHCGGCTSHVTEAVQKLDGVKRVETDLEKAQTTVVYDAARVKPEQIVAAIASTGYEPGTPVVK